MAIVTEYDWESDTFTHHAENAACQACREAVADIAEKAKATLPDCVGRVDRAVAIVLNHDVELLEDGKTKVASQSNGQVVYHVVNGECSCKDYPKAPSNWCKHRIAAGLYKRVTALVQRKLVPHPLLILGYSRFNFVRASSILNCQSTPRCLALVLSAQIPISDWSKGSSPMRRSVRH